MTADISVHEGVTRCRISGDGRMALASTSKGHIFQIDLVRKEVVRRLDGHKGSVNGVSFGPVDGMAVSCGSDRTIRVWSTRDGAEISRSRPHSRIALDVAGGGSGSWIAASSTNGVIAVWSTNSPKQVRRTLARRHVEHEEHVRPVSCIVTENDLLVVASNDGVLEVMDIATWTVARRLQAHPPGFVRCDATQEGNLIVSSHLNRTVRAWTFLTLDPVAEFVGTEGIIWDVSVSRDGRTIAAASINGCVWRLPSPEV